MAVNMVAAVKTLTVPTRYELGTGHPCEGGGPVHLEDPHTRVTHHPLVNNNRPAVPGHPGLHLARTAATRRPTLTLTSASHHDDQGMRVQVLTVRGFSPWGGGSKVA